MENKKTITIAIIVLIIFATGWLLMAKLKDLKGGKNANVPAGSQSEKNNAQNKEEKIVSGTITSILEKQIFIAQEENRETGIDILPNTPVKIIGSDQRATLADLKVGSVVEVKFDAIGKVMEIRIKNQ